MPSTISLLSAAAIAASLISAHPSSQSSVQSRAVANAWPLKKFKSLVAFGDSYTDESRLGYFGSHNGAAPPVGWVEPESFDTADGGRIWVRYVNQYTGANLYDYAVSGAVCSNDLTPKWWSTINAPFPAIKEYEVPAFIADSEYHEANGKKFLDIPADETVYTIWIGTNDIGVYAYLTDSQLQGTLISYMTCVFHQIDRIYATGARYFVINNLAPLNLAPLYALPEDGGVGNNRYWPDKTTNNLTEISYRMLESVATLNSVYQYQLPFNVMQKMYPGAHFAQYDVHGLMTDIYNHPAVYLNGTGAPLNVTGFVAHCDVEGGNCTLSDSPDSFMWYDELHPSEQTMRVIAAHFVDVVKGASKWATYWS